MKFTVERDALADAVALGGTGAGRPGRWAGTHGLMLSADPDDPAGQPGWPDSSPCPAFDYELSARVRCGRR